MGYEIHGDTGTRLYRIWKSMKCRCNNRNHPSYQWYGSRGVKVCPEWENSYLSFKYWSMLNGYNPDLELDRIDVNGNYCPENCRWITHHSQAMNRRDTLYINMGDSKVKLRDFCKAAGINMNTVNNWRYEGILEQKLSELLGKEIHITGGKKVVKV